ncbi:MAG: YggS family pyridoxal phosphate-dependent enzyme [Anaeroplasmataceae bacterium]
MKLSNKINDIINECKLTNTTIIAATKYIDYNLMCELLKKNINNFGENRVDSFLSKYELLKNENIVWHFIGHLQKNKVKTIINHLDYLHSLDNIELALLINKYRKTPLNCFIQLNITNSNTKQGIKLNELDLFLSNLKQLDNINVVGLMTMMDVDTLEVDIFNYYKTIVDLKNKLNLDYTSLGMSNDYKQALKAKTTHTRLGNILFERD